MTEFDLLFAQIVADHGADSIQQVQTKYRIELAKAWNLPAGARVLEIACGQGDMTAVLAAAVGPAGHVTAVDSADPGYGAPETLGEAMGRLLSSYLGSRIEARFECDLLEPAIDFEADAFDFVVMVHGGWYFADRDRLVRTLARVRSWAGTLLFAEWDLVPVLPEQIPHFLAVLIQGQIETYKQQSESNIRTPFTRSEGIRILANAGWTVTRELAVDTSALQDAEWEIDLCLNVAVPEMDSLVIPDRQREMIRTQVGVLESLIEQADFEIRPLPTYALRAARAGFRMTNPS